MAAALGRLLSRSLTAACSQRVAPRSVAVKLLRPSVLPILHTRLLSGRASAKAPKAPEPAFEPEPEDDEGEFEEFPVHTQRRILALRAVQTKYDTANRDYQSELAILQSKYEDVYRPIFDERAGVISGKTDVGAYDLEDDGEQDPKCMPDFWSAAFLNHEKIGMYITERDGDVLKHLTDVRVKVLTGAERGFTLIFHFENNKYMNDKTLEKTYMLEPEEDIIPKKFIGQKIDWKESSLDPTVEAKKKRVKSKEGGKGAKAAFVTELEPCESFFNIFDPPQVPDDPRALEDAELDALQEELAADFDVGYAISTQVIPRAVEWFTGELCNPMDDMAEGDYEDEFEEEEQAPPARDFGKPNRR
eukprot:CAMPEP_0119116616 /NCGR_PEP_ID=MMETSP1180-20130426/52385_1 /TAXON_ID=3052 ORGANISM="Chlamydomonas cf sp, Strain CCMP681" /NCGR_SAMPLE_ID=MMETSP1180 /ASSEMBLY_ACC=CAM_ASM_000741 /LENGTH=359 /DNA_ID=CAMNT_0007105787 /DNA_START=37 /DNA_END=1116 /DNA_ORIENTATION=+